MLGTDTPGSALTHHHTHSRGLIIQVPATGLWVIYVSLPQRFQSLSADPLKIDDWLGKPSVVQGPTQPHIPFRASATGIACHEP